ncbi:MAG: leucine-rich repeat domain-containing protein [Holosporaceae bacterium]|jgi:hypothetical protein|nr:leucine-rich repeat domain-containing protein [Holosporaceae bacterium]
MKKIFVMAVLASQFVTYGMEDRNGLWGVFNRELLIAGNIDNMQLSQVNRDRVTSVTFDDGREIPDTQTPNIIDLIPEGAFAEFHNLESITIPASVRALGKSCFKNCRNLRTIIFSAGSEITEIPAEAFAGCEKLESIIIPASVRTLGESCFEKCYELGRVDFSSCFQIDAIPTKAFANCGKLEDIAIPASVRTLGESCFDNCIRLERVGFSTCSQIGVIPKRAFADCGRLKNITIPAGVQILDESCFENCPQLNKVDISNFSQMTEIKSRAFANCGQLKDITIPTKMRILGPSCFLNCLSLHDMTFSSLVPMHIHQSAFNGGHPSWGAVLSAKFCNLLRGAEDSAMGFCSRMAERFGSFDDKAFDLSRMIEDKINNFFGGFTNRWRRNSLYENLFLEDPENIVTP